MYFTCSFTGHRNVGDDLDIALLDRVLEKLIKSGARRFLFGAALGFDIIAAERVLRLKNKYNNLILCACIPFVGQSGRYPESYKERYNKIVGACDEKVILSDGYYNGCMHVRNRYLVDNCDVLVCYFRDKRGGTGYTVDYAKKCGKKIIEI